MTDARTPMPGSMDSFFAVRGYDRAVTSKGPLRSYCTSVREIIRWRDQISSKYADQVGKLDWDEESNVSFSEDVATSDDVTFHYVAAVFDQNGIEEGYRKLVENPIPKAEVVTSTICKSQDRGFSGRFPQLLAGATYWLPFDKDLILEEHDWSGTLVRFGSLYQLCRELADVRGIFLQSKQRVGQAITPFLLSKEAPITVADSVCDTVEKICSFAERKRIPAWASG